MAASINTESILGFVQKHQDNRGAIIAILEDIQASYNYLPEDALKIVAQETGHSLVDLYGVATFFTEFTLEPRGDHLASVCMGTACHVKGAQGIHDEFTKSLKIQPGQTTEDRSFTLTTVNCLGACALGPVATLDGEYCRNVKRGQVPELIESCKHGDLMDRTGDPEETLYVHALCPHCNRSLMTSDHLLDGQPMIHVTVSSVHHHGWLRLSNTWGDPREECEFEIPDETTVTFFCPKCHGELRSPKLCPRCDAPIIPLLNRKGGILTICSRRGCKEHMIDLS